jgi:spermidine/putrescine transport system ATP-binding protein
MTMSDRIAVMNGGIVEQVAAPRELYQHPASPFVAGFIGVSNLIAFRVDRREGDTVVMDLGDGQRISAPAAAGPGDAATITVRPEWIKLGDSGLDGRDSRVRGTVTDVVYLGSVTQLLVLLPTGERLTVHRLNDEVGGIDPSPGQQIELRWAAEHSYVIAETPGATTDDEPAAGPDEER